MKRSFFSHEDVSTTTTVNDRVLSKCLLQEETKTEVIHLKAFQVEGDWFSFLVTYQKSLHLYHENLDGHEFKFPLERPYPVYEIEHNIPKQFLVSQETCLDHVMIVLSELKLPSHIQERIIQYISTESVKFSKGGGGFRVEVNVNVNVKVNVKVNVTVNARIECRCRVRERAVARNLREMDCPICLKELSSERSRMELQCSHVFHNGCVIKWINKNPSCPICRAKTLGKTVSIF